MTAIAIIHKREILEKLAQGYKLREIAADYGITQPAISNQLKDDPDFREARENACEARIEQWETALQDIGPDSAQVMLGRARELLSHARWRAEREFPDRYGVRPIAVTVNTVSIAPDMLLAASELLSKAYSQAVQLEGKPLIIEGERADSES